MRSRRSAERDYSHRSLFDKLGVNPESRVAIIDAPNDLARIVTLAKHLEPNGALWIVHPKGRGASPADAEVRAAGLAAGLVDNKISAYSDTHTATRYVIPIARRPSTTRLPRSRSA